MTAPAEHEPAAHLLRPLQQAALTIGLVALFACGVGAIGNPAQFFRSYLLAYLFYCGLALGCLALLMMNYLTGGAWGLIPRRILESAAQTLPLLTLLFLPIVIGIPWLYEWARPHAVAQSPLLEHKRAYLNVPFFLLRSALLFVVTSTFAHLLSSWSRRQQSEAPGRLQSRLRTLSGPGLVVYALLTSMAYVDWVMTLTPAWYSTIFGMLIMVGQGLSAYAFVILILVLLARCPPLQAVVSVKVLHDLGKLLQTFVLLWAYLAFCQLLIIWSGNLPHEALFYAPRLNTNWRFLGLLLVVAHFALPFGLLLLRELKRRPVTLAALAGWVLVMRLCDQLWLIEPSFHPQGFRIHVLDILAPIGLGGVWLAAFCGLLQRGPLLPLGDPALAPILARSVPPSPEQT